MPLWGTELLATIFHVPPAEPANDGTTQSRPAVSQGVIEEGQAALGRAAWEEARSLYENELARGESAEAYEGLAWASWWLEDSDGTFAARERAFLLYSERPDRASAARMAVWMAIDVLTFRGEHAVATGWLQRAARLLADVAPCREHALLPWYRGHFAVWSDVGEALELARQAQEVGRSVGAVEFEMVGVGLEGLARVMQGDVDEGMRLIDEAVAAVVAGELKDPTIAAGACCYLIVACERVRDFDRAAQWCHYLEELSRRWRFRHMFALCQTYYAGVLIERGAWDECEEVLREATKEFRSTRPALIAGAYVRLGELRRRQGRLDEAEELFSKAAHDPAARLGMAAVALDRGDQRKGLELARASLRAARSDSTARVPALELVVRGATALGLQDEARSALGELQGVAEVVQTAPLRAAVATSAGHLAALDGDSVGALAHFDDALRLLEAAGLPFEAHCARLDRADVLASIGRTGEAREEAATAEAALRRMGSTAKARAAQALAAGRSSPRRPASLIPLTERELEVLRLVADGCSNEEIAARLIIAEHTVKRHVANIRTKLGASSRTAAAAHAIRQGWL